MVFVDYIVNLGLEGLKGYISDNYDRNQMEKEIRSFVEQQSIINFNCTREEEIDFGGVVEYLCGNFLDDVELRLTGETSEIRGNAHRHIIAVAASYAQANTSIQNHRVEKIVTSSLNILRSFYERKLTREQKYMAVRIADDVSQDTAHQLQKQTATILQAIEKNTVTAPFSHDQVRKLAQDGKLDCLGDVLSDFTDTVSSSHQLKPYYGFRPQTVNGKQQFVSVPLTEDAQKRYPPHFECNGRAFIGEKEIGAITSDAINYANNHQLPIRLVVEDACKYLGTYVDQQQCEVDEIIGEELILPPKPFPEAMAYSIIVDNVTYYEYILLKTKERFEDGTDVFTNEIQDTPFQLTIRVNSITHNVNFTFAINGDSNAEHLKYSRFLKAVHSGGRLKFHHLESGGNLLEVNCKENTSTEYMERLESEIALLQNVIEIENFFKINIDIPNQFTQEDIELIHYIAELIRGGDIKGKWTRYETNMTIVPQTKHNLTDFNETPYSLTYVGSATVNIWGQSLTYPFMRTLLSAKLEKPNKIAKLLEILDEGEDLNVSFIPGDETGVGEYIDRLGDNSIEGADTEIEG